MANGEKLADSVGSLTIEEPRVKSKNLNVIGEFEKSNPKRIANFVVVGKYVLPHIDVHGTLSMLASIH
jgi:hypothetical protein